MSYTKPEVKRIQVEVKGSDANEASMGADGPSRCSSSCCFYRDGGTW